MLVKWFGSTSEILTPFLKLDLVYSRVRSASMFPCGLKCASGTSLKGRFGIMTSQFWSYNKRGSASTLVAGRHVHEVEHLTVALSNTGWFETQGQKFKG